MQLHHQTCSFSLHFSNTAPRNMWWEVDSHGHRTAVRIPWTKKRRILWWLDLHLEHCFIRWQSSFSVMLLFWAGGIIPGPMCWFCNCTRRYYMNYLLLNVHSHCPILIPRAIQIPTTCPNGNLHQFFSLSDQYKHHTILHKPFLTASVSVSVSFNVNTPWSMKQFYPKIQEIYHKEPNILQQEGSAIVVISEQWFFF